MLHFFIIIIIARDPAVCLFFSDVHQSVIIIIFNYGIFQKT